MTPKIRDWTPPWPLNIAATVGVHRRGSGDPAFRFDAGGAVCRASSTPDGAGAVRITATRGVVSATAWGPGADWLLEQLPDFLGAQDEPGELKPGNPIVDELVRRAVGFRLGRTERVWEALVPAILEQKVVGAEAWRAWRHLVRKFGQPAPGIDNLWVPPTRAAWLDIPSWEWHRSGAEPVRMRTIRGAATIDVERHADRLTVLRGVGAWTEAETRSRALGDPDAVSVGDYHIPNVVGNALIGERIDDARMLELLEPFAGQRNRVIRLIELVGPRPERRGPRMSVRDYRRL
ncbi:DNA-3-methyladenine glycosylase family protein [Gordonia sp. CPCC 205333]|uniref:DNA-3-methyladenine glycosylase family protein n=1 Tax=Gordonia sp. CPCC 205333 TaxID=3140790 RepID=UPI003AF36DC5